MFKKMTLSAQLLAAVLITAGIGAIIAIAGYMGVTSLGGVIEDMGNRDIPGLQALYEINEGFMAVDGMEIDVRDFEASGRETLYKVVDEEFGVANGGVDVFEGVPKNSAMSEAWDEFVPMFRTWEIEYKRGLESAHAVDSLLADGAAIDSPEVLNAMGEFNNQLEVADVGYQAMDEKLEVLLVATVAASNASIVSGDDGMQTSNTLILLASVVGLSFAIAFGLIVSRSASKSLSTVIDGLSSASSNTAAASQQVASASISLANGTSSQAAALEETSSALEQITAQTEANAEHAGKANTLTIDAQTAARAGNSSMDQLQTAMGDINESAVEVGKILKTIEEIAFQTNLLALNAAVEAARAGEHGKGFAVVAEEVRGLAQRAASAVSDTSVLIEKSIAKAKNGSDVTTDVGKALSQISESIEQVTSLVSEIKVGTAEQAEGVSQINKAVGQMSESTSSAAARADDTASASEEFSAQAEQLLDMVAQLEKMAHTSRDNSQLDEAPVLAGVGSRTQSSAKALPKANTKTNAPKSGDFKDF